MVAIAFIHPDLGIGGAERFVVDAAMALKLKGHTIHLFTSHHNKTHCFQETRDGSLSVTTVGDWLPRQTCGRLYALWAYIRMIYVAVYLVFFSDFDADAIICDQVSACIPVLKWKKKAKILFYCHFPDLLLTQRKSIFKKLYRKPLDWIEEKTTGMADSVMVNSNFTAGIFHSTFLTLEHITPTVLYPSLNFDQLDKEVDVHEALKDIIPPTAKNVCLSINRYEHKKNLPLALHALHTLLTKLDEETKGTIHMVIAGGYDERVAENREHYTELRRLAESLSLSDKITFVRSFSDSTKIALLKASSCLLYTPSFEHFGLVPVEAMYMSCPVIACNSGGPLETVKDGVTGFLVPPDATEFADAMAGLINDKEKKNQFGANGRQHVKENFSFDAFSGKLDNAVRALKL